jgi:hypothetical protein
MLSAEDQEQIRERGLATLHDFRIVSPTSGEPFYEGGLLCYYDGRILLVCGQPLRDDPIPTPVFVRETIRRWIAGRQVDSVIYIGPEPIDLRFLRQEGFTRTEVGARRTCSAELFLPVDDAPAGVRLSRVYRRANRNGFRARVRPGNLIQVDHLDLVERFYRRRDLSKYLLETALGLPVALMSQATTIIEAVEEDRIRGFVTVHKPFNDVTVALFLAHDETTGVSDFLYAQLVEHARAVGASYVNVGPSPSIGHFHFKRKWRGIPLVPPYYDCTWLRWHARGAAQRCWLQRILRMR